VPRRAIGKRDKQRHSRMPARWIAHRVFHLNGSRPEAVKKQPLHGLDGSFRTVTASRGAVRVESMVALLMFTLTAILILAPVGYLVFGSLRSASPLAPDAVFTGANWLNVYGAGVYRTALLNTVVLAGTVALLSLVLGGILAWIVARTDAPWAGQLALLVVVPLMISNLITTLAWIALAAPHAGFINASFAAWFGTGTIFDIYSFSGIVLVLVMHYTAFAFAAVYAALRSVDGALEEASYMLGAGPVTTGLRMTLPLIWPTIAATFLMIFVLGAENFNVPTLLGAPVGFQTLPTQIYVDMTVEPSHPSLAAAAGTMLLWIALLGTLWQRRILARAHRYVTIGGKGSRQRLARLGAWKYAATGLLLLYILFAVLLPYVALVFTSFLNFLTPRVSLSLLSFDNYRDLLEPENFEATKNSLLYSTLGGLVIAFSYVFLSYLIKRSTGHFARVIDYMVIVPTAIPALVLAVGMLWAFVGLPLPVYGTAAILLIAYFVRFIGYGVRQSRAALVQISDELSEAARMCGASSLRAFKDVTLPLIRPSLLSLWTLLFIFIFTEISATILLYNPDTITLPVALWNFMAAGQQTRAFAIAVIQATIIFGVIYIADRLFGTLRKTLEY